MKRIVIFSVFNSWTNMSGVLDMSTGIITAYGKSANELEASGTSIQVHIDDGVDYRIVMEVV